jgi:hypothetical protein
VLKEAIDKNCLDVSMMVGLISDLSGHTEYNFSSSTNELHDATKLE